MSSTPLSNGLGESGQNPLGRNVAHCTSALLLILTIKCAGSTPLSNGLGESGQNPLGRNAAGCNGYSNKQTLYINTVSNYNTNILTSSPFSNNTSCRRLECSILAAVHASWQQNTLTCNSAKMKSYTARCEHHSKCLTSRHLARHCLSTEKHMFSKGMCTWHRIL